MALVTNNISSSLNSSIIGITGSLIVGNASSLPSMPGADTTFFVSGVNGGVAEGRGVSVFGGDVVISGTLHGGSPLKIGTDVGLTGSLRLSNQSTTPATSTTEAILFASQSSGTTKLFFAAAGAAAAEVSTSGGGGGGETIFTAANASAAYTTSSIAIGRGSAASTVGSDVFFFVSGSGTNVSVFQGSVVGSGSIALKNSSNTQVVLLDQVVGSISGSSDLQSGGTLTVAGNAIVTGSVWLGDTSADVVTIAAQITGSNGLRINNGTSSVQALTATTISGSGDLTVQGNAKIQGSFEVTGSTIMVGDLAVNGGDITTSAATFNIAAGATPATTVNLGGASSRVVVPGDLEVQGTTVTVDVTNITIEDPLIGLGFTTGSVAVSAGDRGFIGGRSATSNVAFAWAQTSDAFVATTTTSAPGATSIVFTDAELKPVRASRFQVSGTNAVISSPNGSDLTVGSTAITMVSGTRVDLDAGSQGVVVENLGTPVMTFTSSSLTGFSTNIAKIDSTSKGMLIGANSVAAISGTQVFLYGGNNGASLRRDGTDVMQFFSGSGATGNDAVIAGLGTNQLRLRSGDRVYFSNTAGTYAATTSGSFGAYSNASILESSTGKALVLDGKGDLVLSRNGTTIAYVSSIGGNIGLYPNIDMTYNLGDPTRRWNNIYTGDLHLRNDRGDYTIIEESDFLSIRFNKTGKRYKFVLEPVPELDEK